MLENKEMSPFRKSLRRLFRRFGVDYWRRIEAVLIATGCWFLIQHTAVAKKTIHVHDIPVLVTNNGESSLDRFEILSPNLTVDIDFETTSEETLPEWQNNNKYKVTADILGDLKASNESRVFDYTLDRLKVDGPEGLTKVKMKPEILQIHVDPYASNRLPIEPILGEQLEDGTMVSVEVPRKTRVKVRGAARFVKNLKSLKLALPNLQELMERRPDKLTLKIENPYPEKINLDPPEVQVTVTYPTQNVENFTDIVPYVLAPMDSTLKQVAEIPPVTVTVKGDLEDLNALKVKRTFRVYLDLLDDTEPGIWKRPVQIGGLPSKIQLVDVQPPSVKVKLERQMPEEAAQDVTAEPANNDEK